MQIPKPPPDPPAEPVKPPNGDGEEVPIVPPPDLPRRPPYDLPPEPPPAAETCRPS